MSTAHAAVSQNALVIQCTSRRNTGVFKDQGIKSREIREQPNCEMSTPADIYLSGYLICHQSIYHDKYRD